MNPDIAGWAGGLNALGFTMFLGASPAAAVVNSLQVPGVAFPVMASKFGALSSYREIKQAYKDFFHGTPGRKYPWMLDFSIERQLRDDGEKQAYQLWHDEGLLDYTLTQDLRGIGDAGINTGELKNKFMDVMAFQFHHAERMNREITALASYRAALKQMKPRIDAKEITLKQAWLEAAEIADSITWTSQYDYGSYNRARFMRGNVARVLFQFKQFSQNTTYLWVNTYKKAFEHTGLKAAHLNTGKKGVTKEEKAEARKLFYWLISTTTLLAGTLGLPVFNQIVDAIGWMFDDDDDPIDAKGEYMQWLEDTFGSTGGNILAKGILNQSGLNFHGRLTLNDLWVRTSERDLEGARSDLDWIEAAGGPQLSIWLNAKHGVEKIADGDVYRGIETMAPKFIKDPMKMGRQFAEDVRSQTGILQFETNWLQDIAQGMGMSSAKGDDFWDRKNARFNVEKAVNDRRNTLIDLYIQSKESFDVKGRIEIDAAIRDFNMKNPNNKILGKHKNMSRRSYNNYRKQIEDGMRVTDKNEHIMDRYTFGQ
jgi:hypothetical protein